MKMGKGTFIKNFKDGFIEFENYKVKSFSGATAKRHIALFKKYCSEEFFKELLKKEVKNENHNV